MACAIPILEKVLYKNALAICEGLGAKLPVMITASEQADIDHRRKQVIVSRYV